MRAPDEISEEDRQRVQQVTTTGIHSVERRPFRPFYMILLLLGVMASLSVVSIVIARFYLP